MDAAGLVALVRDVPDFPQPGIVFKDITPLLAQPVAMRAALDALAAPFLGARVTRVVGIEARGFIVASPVAERLGCGFVPVRKPGKLPWETTSTSYALEYGTDALEVHRDAAGAGDRVLVVDDVLATGGTAAAAVELVRSLGAEVVGLAVLIELAFLEGRARMDGLPVHAVITG